MSGQRDLADGGGGLAVLQRQGARRQAEHAAPERHRAGRHHQHVRAAPMQRREIVGEALQPIALDGGLARLDEQRGADLDDDAAKGIERGRGHG